MKMPLFQEISLKNPNADMMSDPKLSKYLPDPEQLSGKMPERDFFFGIICSLKRGYMKEIITEANKKLFAADTSVDKKEAISLSDAQLEEFMKHPYNSRKLFQLTYKGKPGTGVYLLRESAKVNKEVKDRKMSNCPRGSVSKSIRMMRICQHQELDKSSKKGNDGRPVQQISGGVGKMQIDFAGPK